MKRSNQCPKCSSYNIVQVKGKKLSQGSIVPLNSWQTKTAVLDYIICTDCGYTERYAQMNEKTIKHLKELLDKQGGGFDDFV